jgi:hypothetical protein
MGHVNGLTPSQNQYGFLKMKCQKNLRTVSAGLLFPWYTLLRSANFSLSVICDFHRCLILLCPLQQQGSTKNAVLGEIFLNLTNYLSSVDPTAISLPLKKCSSGTVLQVSSC